MDKNLNDKEEEVESETEKENEFMDNDTSSETGVYLGKLPSEHIPVEFIPKPR